MSNDPDFNPDKSIVICENGQTYNKKVEYKLYCPTINKNRWLNFTKAKIRVREDEIDSLNYEKISSIVSSYQLTFDFLSYYWNYYLGRHDILELKGKDFVTRCTTGEIKRIIYNHAQYVVDIMSSFFMGLPIQYTDLNEKINQVLKENDDFLLNTDIARNQGIFGVAYELIGKKENDDLFIISLDPRYVIPIYDTYITEEIVGFIYVNKVEEINANAKKQIDEYILYTKDFVHHYNVEKQTKKSRDHDLGRIPVIMYKNNQTETSDFHPVITQINEYNELMSQSVANQINMTQSKVVYKTNTKNDAREFYDIATSPIDRISPDEDIEFKNRITQDATLIMNMQNLSDAIHKFTGIFNFAESGMSGNVSGVAVQGKLFALEQKATIKEQYFKKGLKVRIKTLYEMLGVDIGEMDKLFIKMVRNKPTNGLENAQQFLSYASHIPIKDLVEEFAPNVTRDSSTVTERKIKELEMLEEVKINAERKRSEFSNGSNNSNGNGNGESTRESKPNTKQSKTDRRAKPKTD